MYTHTCPKESEMPFSIKWLCKTLKISTRMTTKDDHPGFSTRDTPWECGWRICSVYIPLLGKITWRFLKRKNIKDGCVLHINFARIGNKQPLGSLCSIMLSEKKTKHKNNPQTRPNGQCLESNPFSEIHPKWTTKQSANYWTIYSSLCGNTKFMIPTVKMHGMLSLNIDL